MILTIGVQEVGCMSDWHLQEVNYQRAEGFTKCYAHGFEEPRVLIKLEADRLIASLCMVSRVTHWGCPRWIHLFPGKPTEAYVSGDCLLLLTEPLNLDTAWGMTGHALILDLRNGKRLAKRRSAMAAALGDGHFVLGLEGYDAFDTWMYDCNGKEVDHWRSYGHYIVDPGGIVRVVECDRTSPTRSRIVRLLPHGEIERGPCLTHGQVPRPVELSDGTIVVFDCGKLRAIDRSLNETVLTQLLPIDPKESWRFHGKLTLSKDVLEIMIVERIQDSTRSYVTHRWNFIVTGNDRFQRQ